MYTQYENTTINTTKLTDTLKMMCYCFTALIVTN